MRDIYRKQNELTIEITQTFHHKDIFRDLLYTSRLQMFLVSLPEFLPLSVSVINYGDTKLKVNKFERSYICVYMYTTDEIPNTKI